MRLWVAKTPPGLREEITVIHLWIRLLLLFFCMDEITILVDQCLLHLEHIQNLALSYRTSVKSTMRIFCRDTGLVTLSECTKNNIENWLIDCRIKRKWKAATFRGRHRNMNVFFRWLLKRWKITENPMVTIELPKLQQSLPKGLSRDDAEMILQWVRRLKYAYKFEEKRNVAILAVMIFTWLRKQEVTNLHMDDVSIEKMSIRVIFGKWGKDRIVPISTRLASYLMDYLRERSRLNKICEFFFTWAQFDRGIWIGCVDNMIAKVKKKTKIYFSAHSLRHSFATLMLEGGCDIYTLSKMMGHSKITTTTIYLSCSSRMMMSSIEKHPMN